MKNEDRRSQTKAAGAAGATSSEKETKLRDDHVSSEDDFDDDEDLMGDDDDFDGLDDLDLHEIEQRERQKAEAVTLAESSSSSTSQESEAGGATSATSGSSRRSTVVANHVRKYLPSASQDQFLYINPNAFNADSDCRDSVDFRDEGDLSCADWRAKSKDETCHDAYRTINENDFPFLFPDPGPSVDEEDEAPGDGSAEGSGSDEKSSPGDALTNAAAAGGNKTSAEKLPITEIDGIDDGVTEKETRIENSNTNTSFLFFQLPPADSVIIASSDKKSSGDHTSSSSGTASSSSSADGAAGAPVEDRFTSGIVGRLNVDHQKNKDAKTDAPLSRSDHFQQVYRNFMREKGELRGDRDFSHLHDSLSPAHQKREREELESAQSKLLSRKRMGRATSTSSSSSGQGGRGRDAPASLRNSMMRARKIPYSKFGIEQLLCNCPIACGIGPKGNCRREGCVKTCSVDSTPLMALKQPREYNKPSPGPAFDGPVHAIPGFCPVLNGLAAGRNCVHSYQCLSGRCCPFRKMCVPVSEASPEEESLAALADSATEAAGGGGEKAAQDAPPGPASPQEADATGLLTSGAHSLETPYKPSKRPLSSTSSVSSTSTKLLQIDGVDQVEQEKKAKSTIKALTSSSSAAAAGGPPPAGTSSKNNSKDKDEPKPLPAVVKAMNTDTLAIRLAARPRWLLPLVKSKYSTQDPVCGTPKLESEAEWRRNCDVPNDPSLSKCRCRMGFLLSYWSGHWTKQECAQEQLANGDRYSRQKITLPNATNTTAAPNEEKTEYDYEDLPEPGTLLAEAQQEPMSTSTSDAEGNHSSMSIGTSSKKEHQSSNKDIHFLDTMIDEQTLYSRGGPLPGPRRRSTLFSEFKRRRDGMDARRRRAALELAEKPEDKNRKTDEDANEESSKADETTKHMPLSYFPARHRNFCTFFNEHLGAIDLRLTMKMLLPQAFKADDAYTVIAIDTALRNALNEVPRVTGLVVPRFMKMMLMRVEATTPGKQHDVEDQDSVSEQDDPKEDAGKENEASASQSDEEEKEEAPQGVEKATIGDQHKNAVTSLSMLKSIFTPRRSSSASSLSSNGHNEQDHDDVVHANSLFRERRALLESLSTILGSNGPRRGGGKKNYPGAAPDATRLAAALLQMPASRSSQKDRPDHDVELRQHEHQTHHDGRAIRDRRALLSAALAVSNFLQLEAKSDRDFVVKTTEDLVRQMAMEQEKEDAQESEEVHAVRSSEDSEETTGRVATSSNVHQKALSLLQREKNIVDGILQMFAPSSRGAPPSQAQEDVAGTTKKMNEAGTSSDGSPRELLGGPSSSLVEQETRNTGSSSTTKSGQSISSSSTSSKKWITAAISSVTAAVAPAIAQTDVHSVITQAVETAHAQLPKYRSLQMPAKEDAKDVKEEAKETLKATEGSVGPAMTDAAKKKAEEVGLAPKVTFAHGATSTVRDEKDFLLVAKRVAVDVRMWIRLDDIPAMQHALGSEELRLAVQHQVGAMPSKDSGDKRVGDSVEPELPPLPAMLQARLDSRSAKFPSFAPCALPRLLSLQRPGVDCHPALADHFKDTLYQDWARLVASKERKRHAVAGGKWKAIWGKGPFEKGSRSTRNASGRVNGTRTPFDYTSAISGGEGLPQGLFDAYIGGANSSSISSTPTPSESSSSSSEDDDDVELLVLQHQGEKIDSRDQHQGNKSRNNKSKAFSKTKRSSTHSDENDLATWMGRKIVSFFGGEKLQTAPADNNNMDDPPGSEDAEAVADVFSSVKSSVEDRSGQEQEESESSTDETGLQKDESTVVSGNGTDALEASDNSTDVEEESFNVTNDTEGDAVEPVPMVNGVNVTEVRGTAGSASTPQATTTPVPFSMAEKTRKKRKKSRSTSSFAFERQQMKLHDLHGRRDVDDGSTTSTSSALPPTTGVPSSTAEGNRPHESLQDLIFENPQELYSVRNVDPTIRDRYSSNLAADSDTAPSSTSDKGGRGMAPNAISAEEPGGLVWWFLGSINRPVLTEIRIPFEVHYSDKFIADLKNKDQASTSGKNVADTWDMVTLMADVDVDFENKKPRNKASSSIATPTAEYMKTTSRSRRGPQAIVKQSKGSSQMKRAAPTSHLDLLELVESGTSTPEKEKPKTPRQGSAPVVEKTALSSGTHQRSVDKEDTEPTSSSGEESTKVVALAGNTKDVSEADKKKAIKAATTTSSSRPEQKSAQQLQQLQQGDEAKQGKSAAPPLALDSSAAGGGAAHDVVFTTGQAGFSLARVGNKLLAELSALNYASVVGEDTADDDETAERPGGRKANEDHFLWQRASVRIHEPAGFCPPHTIEYQPKAGAGEKKICADWVCRCPGSGMPAAGAKCPREGASVCEACPQGFAFADEERSGCVPIQPLLERYKGNIPWWNIAPEASSSSTGDDDLDHSFDVDIDDDDVDFDMTDANEVDSSSTSEKNEAGQVKAKHKSAHPFNTHAWEKPDRETETLMKQAAQENAKLWNPVPLELNLKVFDKRPLHIYGPEEMRRRAEQAEARACNATCEKCEEERQIKAVKVAKDRRAEFAVRERACDYYRNSYGDCCESCAVGGAVVNTVSCMSCVMGRDVGTPEVCYVIGSKDPKFADAPECVTIASSVELMQQSRQANEWAPDPRLSKASFSYANLTLQYRMWKPLSGVAKGVLIGLGGRSMLEADDELNFCGRHGEALNATLLSHSLDMIVICPIPRTYPLPGNTGIFEKTSCWEGFRKEAPGLCHSGGYAMTPANGHQPKPDNGPQDAEWLGEFLFELKSVYRGVPFFVLGYSGGSAVTYQLACSKYASAIAGIISVAYPFYDPFYGWQETEAPPDIDGVGRLDPMCKNVITSSSETHTPLLPGKNQVATLVDRTAGRTNIKAQNRRGAGDDSSTTSRSASSATSRTGPSTPTSTLRRTHSADTITNGANKRSTAELQGEAVIRKEDQEAITGGAAANTAGHGVTSGFYFEDDMRGVLEEETTAEDLKFRRSTSEQENRQVAVAPEIVDGAQLYADAEPIQIVKPPRHFVLYGSFDTAMNLMNVAVPRFGHYSTHSSMLCDASQFHAASPVFEMEKAAALNEYDQTHLVCSDFVNATSPMFEELKATAKMKSTISGVEHHVDPDLVFADAAPVTAVEKSYQLLEEQRKARSLQGELVTDIEHNDEPTSSIQTSSSSTSRENVVALLQLDGMRVAASNAEHATKTTRRTSAGSSLTRTGGTSGGSARTSSTSSSSSISGKGDSSKITCPSRICRFGSAPDYATQHQPALATKAAFRGIDYFVNTLRLFGGTFALSAEEFKDLDMSHIERQATAR
ncbi:unnamed protein product [Amoebophrya sp. A25]|nr:unnamed protein product [Amoebophrya sp. A25]|eukprot:GSA25T00011858001.1